MQNRLSQLTWRRALLASLVCASTSFVACGGSSPAPAPAPMSESTPVAQAEDVALVDKLASEALVEKSEQSQAAAAVAVSAVNVWLTTPDGASKLQNTTTVAFGTLTTTSLTITIDPKLRYQPVQGFGASITDSSASVLYRLTAANRDAAMRSLFDPVSGNGLSLLRQPIGASDFVVDKAYTYNDLPAGETDYAMEKFSIQHDEAQIIPLLKQAKLLNPNLRIIATPWSPPAWMKTNNSLVGGALKDTPEIYKAYALYFVKFLKAYRAAGVPVSAVSVQNEPQNVAPKGYPGMGMPVQQQAKFIKVLGPAIKEAGLKTVILGYDHNWSLHPDDEALTPPNEVVEREYPGTLLGDLEAAPWVGGIAYHCYYGDASRQTAFHKQHLDMPLYLTECSGSKGAADSAEKSFSDTLRWHSRNLIIGAMRNWSRSVINWNLALEPNGQPHVGGCDTCTGILAVGPGQTVTPNAEYYLLGHLSRFVKTGAMRVASSSYGSIGWNGQIMNVAFRNPDGSTVLVVHNENDAPRSFAVQLGDKGFEYTLPGGALATFTWTGQVPAESALRLIDPSNMIASANPSGPSNPCCSGDVASHLADDDASSRWSSGTGQEPGLYVQLNLSQQAMVKRVVLDAGSSNGDYVRGYALHVSNDGSNWGTPVATGAGTGQLTTIDIAPTSARYVRVVSTGTVGNWWSVHEMRVYR
jgi:glucosylceramidase